MLLATLVEGVAARRPDHVAVVAAEGERSLTYAELAAARLRVAAGLAATGLGPGDRVAVLTPNCVEQVIAYHAAFAAGVILVPINTRLVAAGIEYVLGHCEASALIVHHDLLDRLPAAVPDHRWVIGGPDATFDELLASDAAAPVGATSPDDVAAILYTSGTTSKPKGVTHTHSSLWHTAANQAWTQALTGDDIHLVSLSAAHIAGFGGQVLATAYAGGTLVMLADPTPQTLLAAIIRHRPTFLQMTPAILAETLDEAEDAAQFASVRCCIAGGDAVPRGTHEHFHEITGNRVTEVCGMTESFSYVMNPPFGGQREGSIGLPAHGTRVRIAREDGTEAEVDEVGELQVKSAATMIGYWNDPERTAEVLRDGWLCSGDMGRRDADGWFHFASRRTDMIIRGGSNISPLEIEDVLSAHPAVAEAAVVGIPDPVLGQRVAAVVRLHPDASASPEELIAFAGATLAEYQTPERIELAADLPRNATGKVDRVAVLKALVGDGA